MSFLDKLLGRSKTAASETDDNSVKGESDDGTAFPADPNVLEEGEFLKAQAPGPPSDDIDPQFIKDTERKASQ